LICTARTSSSTDTRRSALQSPSHTLVGVAVDAIMVGDDVGSSVAVAVPVAAAVTVALRAAVAVDEADDVGEGRTVGVHDAAAVLVGLLVELGDGGGVAL
jgi:hypothetical protein